MLREQFIATVRRSAEPLHRTWGEGLFLHVEHISGHSHLAIFPSHGRGDVVSVGLTVPAHAERWNIFVVRRSATYADRLDIFNERAFQTSHADLTVEEAVDRLWSLFEVVSS